MKILLAILPILLLTSCSTIDLGPIPFQAGTAVPGGKVVLINEPDRTGISITPDVPGSVTFEGVGNRIIAWLPKRSKSQP